MKAATAGKGAFNQHPKGRVSATVLNSVPKNSTSGDGVGTSDSMQPTVTRQTFAAPHFQTHQVRRNMLS
jgi:hypothetical protein